MEIGESRKGRDRDRERDVRKRERERLKDENISQKYKEGKKTRDNLETQDLINDRQ